MAPDDGGNRRHPELTLIDIRAHALPVAIFGGGFAWQFVTVSLPFHIQAISPHDAATTLTRTGWIVGITSLVTVVTSPLWGRAAGRGDPKRLYVVIEMLQALGFVGMALARTLPELFLVRMALGVMGAASTVGFVIAGRAPGAGEVRRQVAAIQAGMTVGHVVGPLAGAVVAARLGFRPSFLVGAAVVFACGALVQWGVPAPPPPAAGRDRGRPTRRLEVVAVALLVLGASIQVLFLAAILPQIVPALGVPADQTIEAGGLLIFASGVAAMLGAMAAPRLVQLAPEGRLLGALLVLSSALVAALALAGSVWSYGIVRFAQVLTVAPVFPLAVARIAQHGRGTAIGFVNSARIAAGFLGPVVATGVLAHFPPAALYLLLATVGVATLGCLPPVVGSGTERRP